MATFTANDFTKLRDAQKVSMEELASCVPCDVSTLYRYINGQLKLTPDAMYKLCERLDCIDVWCSWMATEYPNSYGKVHPRAGLAASGMGALMALFPELHDLLGLQQQLMRDGADGIIDDQQLLQKSTKELGDILAVGQQVMNMLRSMAKGG